MVAPHDLTVSSNGREIFVGELATKPVNALHKFELAKRKGKENRIEFSDEFVLSFKDLPTQTFSKRIYMNDKNFRMSLLIMAFFAVPVLLAVIIGCCVRIRNNRKHHRLNTFLNDMKTTGAASSSVLGDWMNRRKGFEKLEQYSDGENEPLDDPTNGEPQSSDEAIHLDAKQVPMPSMSNSVAFKMGASL